MATTMKMVVDRDGTLYEGKTVTITHTRLGFEYFGGISATLYTDGTKGVGGYTLDEPSAGEDEQGTRRVGTDYGMDQVIRILETVGAEHWEKLCGMQVVVLFAYGNAGWGAEPLGLAGVGNGKVLIFEEHAAAFRGQDF